jgi:hypothetical protein
MALTDPDDLGAGILCVHKITEPLNEFIDDLGWWRANLRAGDTILDVVDRMPLEDDQKRALRGDLNRLGDLGRALLIEVLRVAVADAASINVDWRPGGPPSVRVEEKADGRLDICVSLDCQEPAR